MEFVAQKYLNEILQECQKMKWNIDNIELLFTGGTSARFSRYIVENNYEVSPTAMTDNVTGFGVLGKAWLRKLLSR